MNYLIWTLVATLYAPIFFKLYRVKWETLDYTHAYFILPISLWLAWRKRKQIKELYQNLKSGKNFFSLFILVSGVFLYIFGWRQNYFLISTFSLIPLLFGLITYLYGRDMAKTLSFPIFYLLLLVPPPLGVLDNITLPMRYSVSYVTEIILKFFNYPITREGLLLTIGYYDIFMGQPCSGFRSLITLFSLGLVYVYISKGSLANKLILTSFIVPLALFGNLIRVIILCLITFYFGEEAGQGFFHNFSGIVMFIITVLGLISIESILGKFRVTKHKSQNS